MSMKAWTADTGDEWCVIVFAETRNRARRLAMDGGPVPDTEYIFWNAYRLPAYDKYATAERVMVTNEDLPEGAPQFWQDEWAT